MTLATRNLIAAALIATVTPLPAIAQGAAAAKAAPVGARAGDKELTCDQVAAERTQINAAVTEDAAKKEKGAKIKKGLFGFAKTFATFAIPGAAVGLGGSSMLGSIAAQTASSTASQAVASANVGGSGPVEAKANAKQQGRLDRLDKIGAYRQCVS